MPDERPELFDELVLEEPVLDELEFDEPVVPVELFVDVVLVLLFVLLFAFCAAA